MNIQIEMTETANPPENPLVDLVVDYETVIETAAASFARNYHRDLFKGKTVEEYIAPVIDVFTLWIRVANSRKRENMKKNLSKKLIDRIYNESVNLGYAQKRSPNDDTRTQLVISAYSAMIDPRVRFYQSLLQTPTPSEPLKNWSDLNWTDLIRARFTGSEDYHSSLSEIIRVENKLIRICEFQIQRLKSSKSSESSGEPEVISVFITPTKENPADFYSNYYFHGRNYGREHVAGICWFEDVTDETKLPKEVTEEPDDDLEGMVWPDI